jgi:SAM-dependent methyltransferase
MSAPDHGEITEAVASYYAGRLAEHGPTHWGVDWNSDESQQLRFQQLVSIAGDSLDGSSITDFGCGFGSLATWLAARDLRVDYRGFDVASEMIDAARTACAGVDGASFTTDEATLAVADWTVASGVFNVRLDTPDAAWEAHVHSTLARMAAISRRGMSFNMLTSWSDPERMRDYLYYGSPAGLFDHCRRDLSRHVALLHDYGLWEFTIHVRFDEDHLQGGVTP